MATVEATTVTVASTPPRMEGPSRPDHNFSPDLPSTSPWQAKRAPADCTLPSSTLSHLILKHIAKLVANDANSTPTSEEEYYTRVVSAVFLSNVHYLLYARGLIHTHIGHLIRESSMSAPSARGKKREKFLESLRTLEGHVQGAVKEIRRGVARTESKTVPMALVFGPSPLSPRRVYYIEQQIRGEGAASSSDETTASPEASHCTTHSLLQTYTRSSLNLTLNRFLISTLNESGDSKRGTKVFIFLLQPSDWRCTGWHKRNGVRLDLSSLAECEAECTTRETTPASLLEDSRTPSPVPHPHREVPETPRRREVHSIRTQETPRKVLAALDVGQYDPRPPGSRLLNSGNATATAQRGFMLKPRSQTSKIPSPRQKRNRTAVVGYRIDSCGEVEEEDSKDGTGDYRPPLAWFQCETVIGGFV